MSEFDLRKKEKKTSKFSRLNDDSASTFTPLKAFSQLKEIKKKKMAKSNLEIKGIPRVFDEEFSKLN